MVTFLDLANNVVMSIITQYLDEDDLYNLVVARKSWSHELGIIWLDRTCEDIAHEVTKVLDQLHIVKNHELLAHFLRQTIMTVSMDILTDQYSNVFDYNLPDERTLGMPEYFNKIFGGISAEFIKSYQYVYLQLVFNHVNSRKLRFRTCTRLVITA